MGVGKQTLVGNFQPVMQAPDHAQAQAALAIEYFGHPAAWPDEWLKIARRQPLLFHPELDGLDGVSRAEVVVLVLIGLQQRHQHVTLIGLRGLLLRLEDGFKPVEDCLQMVVVSDRLVFIDVLHIDAVVLGMGAEKLHPRDPGASLQFHHQLVVVAANVEHKAVDHHRSAAGV